jgi:hypothetical protein
MGYKYQTQKDRFSFLPHRNFRRLSRRSSGGELQNRVAAESRRDGRNHEKPRISRIARSEHAAKWATVLQQPRSSRSRETLAMSSRKGARAGGEKGATWVQE